ncbi:type 1 periplasmic-binding domain-containing protein [Mariniflexile rhizosphaerae]|uniref:hypothetical protein n=1 Tax=unclassified Mariniflexile TaxID=2643887 RepID=UPI000CA8D0B0|nr:hypothetical protein [Mariniflexile sp. TRM1-10]PLB19839.1 MAG: hypothetical protein TRG1_1366 [Flavobacteriaceae bacterium FS1-H7996/R]
MENSVEAINNKNTEEYISLIEFDSVLKVWKGAGKKDNGYNDMADLLTNNKPQVIKMYSISYNMLIGTLEKIHKLDKWHFELKNFEMESIEEVSSYFFREKYIMKLEDDKNNQWTLRVNLTRFNDCYYITEPLELNYLSKGW